MLFRFLLILVFAILLAAGGFTGAVITKTTWEPLLFPKVEEEGDHPHHADDEVELSPEALANLDLNKIKLESYTKSIRIPGKIVPIAGKTTVGVTTAVTGVIHHIKVGTGEVVKSGDDLFQIHLHSHDLQKAQADLYKAVKDLEINQAERMRLDDLAKMGAIPEARMLELQYQQKRLKASVHAMAEMLAIHLISPPDLKRIKKGNFVNKVWIKTPGSPEEGFLTKLEQENENPASHSANYQVEHLLVKPGDEVQPGQRLCTLSNFSELYLEGRVFPAELPFVNEAVRKSTRINVEVEDLRNQSWTTLSQSMTIQFLNPDVDPSSQTVGAYVKLNNPPEEYTRNGRKYWLWNYRPGQRIFFKIPTREVTGVFVLPATAIAREGGNAYVFRQDGDVMQRRPVQILFRDRDMVIIKNTGSINQRNVIAHRGGAQLQRLLQLQEEGGGHSHGHHHPH